MNDNERPAVAAIVNKAHGAADSVLAEFARHLSERGWRVRGVVQDNTVNDHRGTRQMALVDLHDGTRFVISQDLGPGSVSCSVDPAGIAAASIVLRRSLAEGADLVIANRFGEREAGGSGFATEMLALMSADIPLLTVVGERYLEDWRRFTGNTAKELAPQREALETWFADLIRHRQRAK